MAAKVDGDAAACRLHMTLLRFLLSPMKVCASKNICITSYMPGTRRLLCLSTPIKMCQATQLQPLFYSLAGMWSLNRDLASANVNEPAGKCIGTATLTPRAPSSVADQDGSLQVADAEMLYHETGEFHLPNNVTMPFTKKYIWRFNQNVPKISLWFCKPGTEKIDYLFHNIDLTFDDTKRQARGTGGHLCIDDFYSTSYAFQMAPGSDDAQLIVESWDTVHEVQGPKKDQILTTRFSRA